MLAETPLLKVSIDNGKQEVLFTAKQYHSDNAQLPIVHEHILFERSDLTVTADCQFKAATT